MRPSGWPNERQWVCLRKSRGPGLALAGPFNRLELEDLLRRKELTLTDLIWREGYATWQEIGSVRHLTPPTPAFPQAQIGWTHMPSVPYGLDFMPEPRGYATHRPSTAVASDDTWLQLATFALLAAGCLLVGFVAWRQLGHRVRVATPSRAAVRKAAAGAVSTTVAPRVATSPAAVAKITATPARVPARVSTPVPAQRLTTVRPAATAPKQLTLTVHVDPAFKPHIEIHSDASWNYPLTLQIVGVPGKISSSAGFHQTLTLGSRGALQAPVLVPALNLPFGYFVVRVLSGGLKREVPMAIGVETASYRQALKSGRSPWIAQIEADRHRLVNVSQILHSRFVSSLTKHHRFNWAEFDVLRKVGVSSGRDFVLFDDWWELREIWRQAGTAGTPSADVMRRLDREIERLRTVSSAR